METQLKEHIHPKKFILLLLILTALFGVATVMVAEICILPFGAFYALLLWFEPNRKLGSAILPILLLIFSFLGGIGGIFAICSGLCCGLLLWFCYKKQIGKTDTAFILTTFFVFYLLLALFLSIGNITKDYSFSAVLSYYDAFIEEQRVAFVDILSELQVADETGASRYLLNPETAEMIFFSVVRLSVSFIVIAAFVLCGLVLKIFSRMVTYAQRDEAYIRDWRFLLPNICVYFYFAVFVLSSFSGDMQSVFGITVQNLYSIFMVVFAYPGISHLAFLAKRTRRRTFFILLVIMSLFMLSVAAVQILSFLGVYATIAANRTVSKE